MLALSSVSAPLSRRAFLHGSARAVLFSGFGTNLLSACGGSTDNNDVAVTARLASVENFRDVAGVGDGYPTADGKRLRRGVFYRSGALTADDHDAATLDQLGIRAVYDLRTVSEAAFAQDRVPKNASKQILDIAPIDVTVPVPSSSDAASTWMANEERRMIVDPVARARFGVLLTKLATTPGPQIFHGATGRDRTGWAAALLLAIASVPVDVIMQDYLLTNLYASASIQARIDAIARRSGQTAAANAAPLYRAEASTLQAAFDQIQQSFGTLDNYLSEGLSVDTTAVAMLRAKLVA